jgi:phosphoribosylaminoimidazole carboxylase (NCAIR synthetase)
VVLLRRADGESLKRVLLLATTTGYQIRSFGDAAAKLGIRLMFASDRCDQIDNPWWDHAIPVRFHDEEKSINAVVSGCGEPPDGIVAVGDRPVVLAAHLAQHYGLPGHPPQAAAISRNKLLTRQALKETGLRTPAFASVAIDADARAVARRALFPAVVKPQALSGSRGVIRANDEAEFVAAFERLRAVLRSPDVRREQDHAHDRALIESFIPGREYAVEAVLTKGTLQVLAIFDKPDRLDGPFFEETIYVTPSRASRDVQRLIESAVGDAARAIGLYHGPIHAECRLDGSAAYVLEVAARPIGGLCSRALKFCDLSDPKNGPTSLEELLLRHAIGDDIAGYAREAAASGVMMIPIPRRGVFRRVEGVADAGGVAGVEEVRITAKPDAALIPLPEGKSYLGFIFARGGTVDSVETALRDAHRRLNFVIDREVAVVT